MGKARIATARKIAHLESDLHDIVKTGVGRSEAYDTLSVEIHGIGRPRSNSEAKVRELEALERATKERGERMVLNAGAHEPDRALGPKPGDIGWCEECGGICRPEAGWRGVYLSEQRRGVRGSHASKGRHRTSSVTESALRRLARHAGTGEFSQET